MFPIGTDITFEVLEDSAENLFWVNYKGKRELELLVLSATASDMLVREACRYRLETEPQYPREEMWLPSDPESSKGRKQAAIGLKFRLLIHDHGEYDFRAIGQVKGN